MANNSARPERRDLMKRIPLTAPIETAKEGLITEVFISRPTARVLEALEKIQADDENSSASAAYEIVALGTGLDVDEVKALALDDFETILSEVADFFEILAPASPVPDGGEA